MYIHQNMILSKLYHGNLLKKNAILVLHVIKNHLYLIHACIILLVSFFQMNKSVNCHKLPITLKLNTLV